MKGCLSILLLLGFFIVDAQRFADKKFYLIDSLNLAEFTNTDKLLLDSCLTLYHNAENKIDRINALFGICDNMVHHSWSRYQFFQLDIIKDAMIKHRYESKKTQDIYKKALADALNNIGFYYDSQGSRNEALKNYQKSLRLRKELRDKKGVAGNLNNIGYAYYGLGKMDLALKYLLGSLELSEKIGDEDGISTSLNNLGLVYTILGDDTLSLTYFRKGLELQEKLGSKLGVATGLNNIGTCFKTQGKLDEALEYFKKSLAIQKEIGNKAGIASNLNNMAIVYDLQNRSFQALDFYHQSLKLDEQVGNKSGMVIRLNNIGQVLYRIGKYKEAFEYVFKGFSIATKINSPKEIKKAALILSKLYKVQNHTYKSLEMYKLYVEVKDSLNNKENRKRFLKKQASYEYEKQRELNKVRQRKQMTLKLEEKKQQQVISYTTSISLVLLVLFLLVGYNRLLVSKKENKIINEQKMEVEEQKMEIEKAHEFLKIKDKEIADSILYAKRIQLALMPSDNLLRTLTQEIFVLNKPKEVISGNFYWVDKVDGKVMFALTNTKTRGIPGAMIGIMCNNALNRCVKEYKLTDPGDILSKTNEIITREFGEIGGLNQDMDIALCMLDNESLCYTSANIPLWLIRKGKLTEMNCVNASTTNDSAPEVFSTSSMEIKRGDVIYLFSKELLNQFRRTGIEGGGKERLETLLLSIQKETCYDQERFIDNSLKECWSTFSQTDDICIIGLKI